MPAHRLAFLPLLLFATLPIVSSAHADQDVEIFNGKDFTGWTILGGKGTYAIEEDGVIVGRSAPNTTNTFLATDQEFGDFVLELDFKIDDTDFNSGIQIRSQWRQENDQKRVYGYQVEIDPRPDRAWSAGLYSEATDRGWLDDLDDNEPARKAFKLGEWNHLKIEAKGRRIRTWINGVPAADFTDEDDTKFVPKGLLALQVHSVGGNRDAKEVRWRNLKMTVLE